MILLKDKTNVIAPNSDYPFGDIKNNGGSNNGTPVDRDVYSYVHQFFEKMFAESAIVANGLPENETNGFQLFEAFRFFTSNDWLNTGLLASNFSFSGATLSNQVVRFRKRGNMVEFNISFSLTITNASSWNNSSYAQKSSNSPNFNAGYLANFDNDYYYNPFVGSGVVNCPTSEYSGQCSCFVQNLPPANRMALVVHVPNNVTNGDVLGINCLGQYELA